MGLVTYQLDLPVSLGKLHNAFHISLLSKHTSSHIPGRKLSQPPPLYIDDSGEFYEIEDILDSKRVDGRTLYLVAWKGYGKEHNTWEPTSSFENCCDVLQKFKNRHNI